MPTDEDDKRARVSVLAQGQLRPKLRPSPQNTGRSAEKTQYFRWWLAVAVGFEPTEGVNPHALSRRAPSAARTRYRRSPYRTYRRDRRAVVSEEFSEQGSALVS
jgi:hypothetical protein